MSIEKIDFSHLRQERKAFTTHLNVVLQNLHDAAALGVWAFLSSLPDQWVVNRQHLMKHFNLGRDKLNTILKTLRTLNLLEVGQERLPDGSMGAGYISIKCGYEFSVDNSKNDLSALQPPPLTENQYTGSPHTGLPYTVEPLPGKSAPINKTIIINKTKLERECSLFNQEDQKQKRKSALSDFSTKKAHATEKTSSGSEQFLPDQKNRDLCQRLGLTLSEELNSFANRHRGQKNQYEFERWIKNSHDYKSKILSHTKSNEPKCNVPWWPDVKAQKENERYN
jgi:hypothetical protein